MDDQTEFSSNDAAFDFACANLDCEIEEYKALPALIMNANNVFDTPEGVKREPDGTQLAILKVASSDGGFLVLSKTFGPLGPALNVGDFVAWMPAMYNPKLAASGDDPRFGWVGFIYGTLLPRREGGSWVGSAKFG